MEIGIVGLPNSGKTTVFNAVTRGLAQVGTRSSFQGKANLGVAKVPDPRLDALEGIFKPKRKVGAEVTYMDLPAPPEGRARGGCIAGEALTYIQTADALLIVARAFEDPAVPHVADRISPSADVEEMMEELAFADIEILTRRLLKLEEKFKGAKAMERESLNREKSLLVRMQAGLEGGAPIRDQHLDPEETRLLEGFQFLSAKPIIVVINVGEKQLPEAGRLEGELSASLKGPRIRTAALCGKLEAELAQLELLEEQEFRRSMGLGESGLNRMVRTCYEVLDLVTFFTSNASELRAWPIARGTPAPKAAGRIHSDIERGFIRAEVIGFDDLMACGSIASARGRGLLRQEGKGYVVADGDVIHILFNV